MRSIGAKDETTLSGDAPRADAPKFIDRRRSRPHEMLLRPLASPRPKQQALKGMENDRRR